MTFVAMCLINDEFTHRAKRQPNWLSAAAGPAKLPETKGIWTQASERTAKARTTLTLAKEHSR